MTPEPGGRIQRVEHVHGGDDDHDQVGPDAQVEGAEGQAEAPGPAEVGVVGADEALRKDEVDDEEEDDAGLDEDAGGDGEADVARARGPGEAQGEGGVARHAEAEEERREEEPVVAPPVDLEDDHVDDGAGEEEGHEHGADGPVDGQRGHAAELRRRGWVRGRDGAGLGEVVVVYQPRYPSLGGGGLSKQVTIMVDGNLPWMMVYRLLLSTFWSLWLSLWLHTHPTAGSRAGGHSRGGVKGYKIISSRQEH